MVVFISQAPIFAVLLPVLVMVVLVEMIGMKVRRNILVLSALGLVCLGASALVGASDSPVAGLLYAIGVSLSVILALYALATARRGKQGWWFVGVLIASVATLVGAIAAREALSQEDAAIAVFALTFVPGACALLYGLLAPDIPRPRGSI